MNRATERVVTAIAERLGLTRDVVLSRNRSASVVLARMVSVYTMREHQVPRPSLPELGREFALDHTTVMSAVARVRRRLGEPVVLELVDVGKKALEMAWKESEVDTLAAKCRRLAALQAEVDGLIAEIEASGLTPIAKAKPRPDFLADFQARNLEAAE